jgi:WhiB family redox-sensing transcriptional regulator
MTSPRQNKQTRTYAQLQAAIRSNGGVECEQVPDVFFFEDSPYTAERKLMVQTAQTICQRCPIVNQCGEYAVLAQETYGVWGGLTPADRERLRKK